MSHTRLSVDTNKNLNIKGHIKIRTKKRISFQKRKETEEAKT